MRNQLYQFIVLMVLSPSLYGQFQFEQVAEALGVSHQLTESTIGSGISCYDFTQDGLDDLTLGSSLGEPIAFYENTGDGFVKLPPLIDNDEMVKQINWVDYDNDGDPDLYVAANDGVSRLYQNVGELNLQDVTEISGLPLNTHFGYGACWGDYNRDGWLDLYYASKGIIGDPNAIRSYNRLFQNRADGTFLERTFEANAADDGKLPFCAAFIDYNNDLWPDIYIANDKLTYNTLLHNTGEGWFADVSAQTGADARMNAMCVNPGDYNQDGLMDIYVTNTPVGSQYLKNEGPSSGGPPFQFINVAEEMNIHFPGGNCWGSNFLDADNDGDLDLYVSSSIPRPKDVSSAFYENILATHFDIPQVIGMDGDTTASYSNAIGDVNNDGAPDIIVQNNPPDPFLIWENQYVTPGNWIKIKLEGVVSNRDGIGSRIEAYVGEMYQMQFTLCGSGFLGQNSNQKHFGLGENESLDSIVVTWSTGHRDVLRELQANQVLSITEGSTTGGIIDIDDDIAVVERQMTTLTLEITELNRIITIGPNPSAGMFNLDSKELIQKLTVTDLSGQVRIELYPSSTFVNVDLSSLNAGLYLIELHLDGDRRGVVKWVKG